MAVLLAWRNLTHDRSRFLITLIGIAFAVILTAVQLGLFKGFSESTTTLIRHTRADLWIMSKGTRYFEITRPLQDDELYRVRSVPGVATAEGLIILFTTWNKPYGGDEGVLLIGFDLNSDVSGVWGLIDGDLEDLRHTDAVVVESLYLDKLDINGTGDTAEIAGHAVRVVGLTRGVRSFTNLPPLFTSARTAQRFSGLNEHEWNYVLITLEPGADPVRVRSALRGLLGQTDVYLADEFAKLTNDYWTYTTGAGASVLLSALIGVIVGGVIVAQVLYATTIDHLKEFGTLRAMGAPRFFIYQVILLQAAISAVLGHLVGITVSIAISRASENGPVLISVTPGLAAALFLLTLLMCVVASFVSIRKAIVADPAVVFQR
jgi:putative ABC transport system permease protein